MKILTVVGARPQFVKAAAVSRILRTKYQEIFVHTGQHYDRNMSDIFFDELNIPKPDYNLGIGSGSHAAQTGQMMIGIENILLKEKPDLVLIYGDTNSTLAAALAASKIHIPVAHVEAGLRSFNMRMPEEQNRVLADRISAYLFCPTDTAVDNLKNEGITKNVYEVGDVMCDAVLYYGQRTSGKPLDYYNSKLVPLFDAAPKLSSWYMATIHRAENTDSTLKIENILAAFENLDHTVLFPVHPRTKKQVAELYGKNKYKNIYFCEPIGYIDMLYFTKNAVKAVTDSGGLQKEAYILDTACVTVRDQTEWVETLVGNNNILAKPETADILQKVLETAADKALKRNYYGDGHACEKIVDIIERLNRENCN